MTNKFVLQYSSGHKKVNIYILKIKNYIDESNLRNIQVSP